MSVSDFQDALERRAVEVRNELAIAEGEERNRLENEKAEIERQLAGVQVAYGEQQERIGELEVALARHGSDVDDDRLAEVRTALEAGDFSKAESLFRQALEISRETLGEGQPDYATWLNNLASLV